MTKILKNYRYYVLFVLMSIAMLGIFSVPIEDQPLANWIYCLLSSKIIGVGAGWIAAKLYKRWEAKGRIPELTDSINNF